jgi:predicted PurR-regulated permease PerM
MLSDGRVRFWVIVTVGAALVLWAIGPVLSPFLAGMFLAYMLHPICRRLAGIGISNGNAAALVVGGFFVAALTALGGTIPFLWAQAQNLVVAIPQIRARVEAIAGPWWARLQPLLPADILEKLQDAATASVGSVASAAVSVLKNAVASGFAVVDVASFVIVTPLVGYYLLRDYDPMVNWMEGILPRAAAPAVLEQARLISEKLSAWLRGQTLSCLILAAWYATGLTIVGLQFGLLIGLFTGLCAFIPFVGFLFGLTFALLAAIFSYQSWVGWALVGGVFAVGNLLEGYILTPKLVGKSVGLNEVWVMLALLAAGHLFGFVGVMFAVPGAAVIGVLARTALHAYRDSRHYKGEGLTIAAPRMDRTLPR